MASKESASQASASQDAGTTAGPLTGMTVVDLSTTLAGALATQFLAEAGCEVIAVEPPGGSPLRSMAAWPVVGGGKRSVVLELHDEAGRDRLRRLIGAADGLVTTMRPAAAQRLGLDPDQLAALNPRLVSLAITGWGSSGPWSALKGYEGLVMAKLGMFHSKRFIVTRPGPAFVSAPFASWGAAQTAVHGMLAAFYERESSGVGQHVEADLVRGASMFDTWTWFERLIAMRWPEAYPSAPATTDDLDPQGGLIYALLVGPTKDGHWLQFAQVDARLFQAMLAEFEVMPLIAQDPQKWKSFPMLDTPALRIELWDYMLTKLGERTLAEWQQVFDTNPNINAEIFRSGRGVLDHPQLVHDGRVVTVDDPERGTVRRPSTLVHVDGHPLTPARPAPALDADGQRLMSDEPAAAAGATAAAGVTPAALVDNAPAALPLAGVTIVEFGVMFAAPFASTILTDLGARVIKIEPLEGDSIRRILPFPEAGGARVMQGKESVALDLATDDGRAIAHELVRRADIVLQGFRAGAAEHVGVDEATLRQLNPELVYVNAPGYGTDGPYGRRPAYAPSIGAAIGLALTDAPDVASATGTLTDIKRAAIRLAGASAVPSLQADGMAALGVASAMMLGLLARARQRPLPPMTVTMLGTGTQAMVEQIVDYDQRPPTRHVDADGLGLGALYRMYQTSAGWLFLAAPAEREWRQLVRAIAEVSGRADADALLVDERFATPAAREVHDAELADELGKIFAGRSAQEWEKDLTAHDVGCVQVTETDPETQLQTDPELAAEYARTATSPVFDEHLRMGPPVRFSRSLTRALGGCLAGEHTDAVLAEIGYDAARIARLRSSEVIA